MQSDSNKEENEISDVIAGIIFSVIVIALFRSCNLGNCETSSQSRFQ